MLNKENTKKAEQIAEQLRPLFARAYELGAIYEKTRNQQHKAQRVAHSWQFLASGRDWEYISDNTNTQKEREEMRKIKEENPRKWAEILENKYKKEHDTATAHQVARINFINYLQYFARYVGDLIRPNWREFAERQGLQTLAEIINQKNPRPDHSAGACSVSIYNRGGELATDKTQAGQYLRIECAIYTGWACGISGNLSRVYQINPAEVWHYAEEPHRITQSEYIKNSRKIAQQVEKIKEMRDNLQEFARACGLLGFVPIVGQIEETK